MLVLTRQPVQGYYYYGIHGGRNETVCTVRGSSHSRSNIWRTVAVWKYFNKHRKPRKSWFRYRQPLFQQRIHVADKVVQIWFTLILRTSSKQRKAYIQVMWYRSSCQKHSKQSFNPLTANDELSRHENLNFLWAWILRWVFRSFATHTSLCNTLSSNKPKTVKILAMKGLNDKKFVFPLDNQNKHAQWLC